MSGGRTGKWSVLQKAIVSKPETSSVKSSDSRTTASTNRESVLIDETLRNWHKKKLYGDPKRAYGKTVTQEYEEWYVEQRDRFATEIPEPIQENVAEEALSIVEKMYKNYCEVVGKKKKVTVMAKRRIDELNAVITKEAIVEEDEVASIKSTSSMQSLLNKIKDISSNPSDKLKSKE